MRKPPPPPPTTTTATTTARKHLRRLQVRAAALRSAIVYFSTQLLATYPRLPTRVLRMHYDRLEEVLAALQAEVAAGACACARVGTGVGVLEEALEECELLLDEAVEAAAG
jgi:hypothetical protein